jgi:hypothetical protein
MKRDYNTGIIIRLKNACFNIKGKYTFLSKVPKNFLAKINELNMILPFFLIKNESGLVTSVDISGFSIDIDKIQIELDLDIPDFFKNLIIETLKLVLKIIKEDIIEKNFVEIINTKLADVFQILNSIIINRVEPEELHIIMDETDIADIRNSSMLGSLAYLLNNLTGINGPLNLNYLVNLFTFNTSIINLRNFYDKEIHFGFNFNDKNNKRRYNRKKFC